MGNGETGIGPSRGQWRDWNWTKSWAMERLELEQVVGTAETGIGPRRWFNSDMQALLGGYNQLS